MMTERQRAWLLPPSALLLTLGVLAGQGVARDFLPWIAFAACLVAVFLLRGRLRWFACLALAFFLGLAGSSLSFHPVLPPEGPVRVQGVVSDEIRWGSRGHASVVLTGLTLDGVSYSSGAYWTFYTDELPADLVPGRQVSFQADLYHPSGMQNPEDYDFRTVLLTRHVTIGLYGAEDLEIAVPASFSLQGTAASLRHRVSARLAALMGEEAGAYTAALLLGARSLLPSEDRALFSRLGLAHILTVSGYHVGILVAILAFLFRCLRLPQPLRLVLFSAVLLAYCLLTGWNQPVLRASLVLLLLLLGKVLARPRSGLHLLSAVYILLLAASPVQITSVSFRLTFGAAFGITLLSPAFLRGRPARNRFTFRLRQSCGILFGAAVGTLYPLLEAYQTFPLLGVFLSVPVTALFSVLISFDWLLLLLLPVPALAAPVARLSAAATSGLVSLLRSVASLPAITLWTTAPNALTALGIILLVFCACSLFRISRRLRFSAVLFSVLLITVSLVPLPHRGTEYIQFSVGNADAAVLWDQDTVYVLDAGDDNHSVSGFLRRRRLTPDAVIVTHLHSDHCAGLRSLLEDGIPVSLCYLPEEAESALIDDDVRLMLQDLRSAGLQFSALSRGDQLPLPSGGMLVLWPVKGKIRPRQDANSYSLSLLITLRGTRLLAAGDLDSRYEGYAAPRADILKVAHHGSADSASPEFMEAVSPSAILLSTGRAGRAGEFLARTGFSSADLYSTDSGGALTVRFEENSYTLSTFLPDTSGGDRDGNP